MSEERTTTVELHQNGTVYKVLADGTRMLLESDFDWTRFDALSEDEVTAAASADPDNPPLTEAELAGKVQIPMSMSSGLTLD